MQPPSQSDPISPLTPARPNLCWRLYHNGRVILTAFGLLIGGIFIGAWQPVLGLVMIAAGSPMVALFQVPPSDTPKTTIGYRLAIVGISIMQFIAGIGIMLLLHDQYQSR